MLSPKPLVPNRVRKIQGSFSWIDHRLITGGFLEPLTPLEILFYFFLVAVGDRQGLSFYHDDRLGRLLKIDLAALGKARRGLIEQSLLAYDPPLYQVLALPPQPQTVAEDLDREKALVHIRRIREVCS
jgi:hypothetical protein